MLYEDSIFEFLLVSHPLEYYHGYDGNRFMDKPCLPMKPLDWHKSLLNFIVEGTTFVVVWYDVPCSGSNSSMTLFFDTPTLNNETVAFNSVIVPIEDKLVLSQRLYPPLHLLTKHQVIINK